MANTRRTTSAASLPSASEAASSAETAPKVTTDANAPVDPIIASETEALRADPTGQSTGSKAAESATTTTTSETVTSSEAPASTETPTSTEGRVADLGGGASAATADSIAGPSLTDREFLDRYHGRPFSGGTVYSRSRPSGVALDIAQMAFSHAGDVGATMVRVDGVAGDQVEIAAPLTLPPGFHTIYFFDRAGEERQNAVSASPNDPSSRLLVLQWPSPRPLNAADAIVIVSEAAVGFGQTTYVAPPVYAPVDTRVTAPLEVPLAAPAVQPTAVVDPAFLRVALSAKVVEVTGRTVRLNSVARSEPDHDYGLRYVDQAGTPRIRRVEPFGGPIDTFTLAGDPFPPLLGSDVQLGVLASPIDVETGQRLRADGFLSLRELGDGTAIAVTADGRKIRVAQL